MKTSTKLSFLLLALIWVAVALDEPFFTLGFLFLQLLVVFVYADDLNESSGPTDKRAYILMVNRYDTLRQRVTDYVNMNNAQILQSEDDKFRKIFTDYFKDKKIEDVDKHIRITAYTSFTNQNEIECKAEAISKAGAKILNTILRRSKRIVNKAK